MRRPAIVGAVLALGGLGVAAHASVGAAPPERTTAATDPATTATGRLVLGSRPPAPVRRAAPDVLRSDGYRGIARAPRTRPAPPPDPVVVGEGEHPDVHVDAAGTAHIVFNEDVTPPAPDVTHYCRLPRGATACDNPSATPMPIDVEYASDDAGPRIFQLGDQLVVLTHRYPPVVEHPDGEQRDRTTYAWTSSDGGTTWTGPGIVGTLLPSGDAALVGTGEATRIAAITATYTPGTFVQMLDAGSFTAAETQLGGGADAYEGTVAPDGAGVVAAFANRAGGITVRRVPDAQAAADPAAWSSAPLPGEELPRLAGGPRGTFLLSRDRDWRVRRVAGGTPAAPASISAPRDLTEERDLLADPSGRLHAAFAAREGDRVTVTQRSSVDGATWGPAFALARARSIDQLALGAAEDGGGVLVHRRDPTGTFRGTIAATAFGTLAPTGRPGAGSLAGSGIPGGFAGCREAGFGDVVLTPRAGCLLESRDPRLRGALVSRSEVDLNGLVLVPDAGVSIVFDPRRRTLDTTGKVRVLLRGPGIGDVELAHVELHARLGAREGQSLFEDVLLPAGANLKGFPIDADVDVKVAGDGLSIPVSLRLPPSLGSLSADATLRLCSGSGAVLESFRASAASLPLGPVTIGDLEIAYDGTAERWSGTMGLELPLGALTANVVFERGAFAEGRFELRPPRPGILVFKETYFTGVGGSLALDPLSVSASASFGFGYHPPPADVFLTEVEGTLRLTLRGGAAELGFTGTGKLYGAEVGQWDALFTTDGFARLNGGYDLDLGIVAFDGTLEGFVDAPTERFGASFDTDVTLFSVPISGARGAISSAGLGACVTAPPLPPRTFERTEAGIGYAWGGKVSVLFGETCGLERYMVPPPAGRGGARQAGPLRPFGLPAGLDWVNVAVDGQGGAPAVDVIAPDGRRVTPQAPGAPGGDPRVGAVEIPESEQTVVVLDDPAGGDWQVVAREGSVPVTGLRVAQSTEPLEVTGRVTRTGPRRTLRYAVQAPPGTTIRFVETGGPSPRELGRTTRARGTVRVAPGPGRGGRRTIEAIPEREGLPGAPVRVTTYVAPPERRLGRPRGLHLSGRAVRWRAVAGARDHLVTATLASGRAVAVVTGPRARRAHFAERVARVRVAARAADGTLGRAAVARAGRR